MTYATAAELAGLPGLPGSERRVREAVTRLGIKARPRQGKGGGLEYLVDDLPEQARKAFARRVEGMELDDDGADWVTAKELIGLPGFPDSEFRARERAQQLQLPTRLRQGVGGGEEFYIAELPKSALFALRAQRGLQACQAPAQRNPLDIVQARAFGTQQAAHATGRQKERQDAISRILILFRQFHAGFGGPLTPALRTFATAWTQGRIECDEALRSSYPRISWSTLRGWYLAVHANGLAGITKPEHHRKGMFTALAGEVGNAVLALLMDRPHLSAAAIYRVVAANFGDGIPSERAFRRALSHWMEQNAQLFCAVTNPDAWRNKFMSAAGSADEHVTAPNQLWEMDSTPGDVMLADGSRHAVVGVIDVFTRRRMFLVTRTSTSAAIMSLMRLAIAAWGMPQSVKTDNGKDYVANQFDQALLGLGIEHQLCPPFTPQAKPHIERAIGALMHEHFELLDGYIGHSVADRKDIEARRAFSERLFDKHEGLELRLTPEQLQGTIDSYCERLHDRPRAELQGNTPLQQVQRVAGFEPLMVSERALDVLLAPSAGSGIRTIGKKGIRISGGNYNHAWLGGLEGKQVQVKVDDANLGRCWVFQLDGVFICEALDYTRLGIKSAEVAAERRAHQARALRESKRLLRDMTRQVDTREAIARVHAARAESAIEQSPNVVSLPSRKSDAPLASTRTIDSIAASGAPVVDEQQIAQARQAMAESQKAQAAQVLPLADSQQQRFARWLKLQQRVESGQALTGDEKNWFEGYAHGPEWASMKRFFEIFELDADQFLAG